MGTHITPFRLLLDPIPVFSTDGNPISWKDIRGWAKPRLYELHFTDRSIYVGMSNNIPARIGAHKHRPQNTAVYTRLLSKSLSKVVISPPYASSKRAHVDELAHINLLRQRGETVLNKVTGPSPPGVKTRKFKQKGIGGKAFGEAKCSLCKQYFSVSQFNTDRSRHTGIASKCKTCHNNGRLICYEARRRGLVNASGGIISSIWQRFKADPTLTRHTFPWHEFEKP